MSVDILKYPLDITGLDNNNLVLGERHELTAGLKRAFVPTYGAFFSESLVVRESETNKTLVSGVDYVAAQLEQSASLLTGKEICSVIVITNPEVDQRISIDYQALGGEFSASTQALVNMVENLDLDERPVLWGDILGKPTAYPPTPHLHDIGDLYGFEYVVEALAGVREAIMYGDAATFDELRNMIVIIDDKLKRHTDRLDNPHNVTKAQVGLGSVQNYGVATKTEAEAGASNVKYMTPLRTKEAIDFFAGNLLRSHIADKTNPHEVTKAQVGLGSVQNYGVASKTDAESGTSNVKYMTPLRTKEAIDFFAGNLLRSHIADKTNPHNVTKAQVGLGSVQNYGIASTGEAIAGTSNVKYMTPLRTKEAVNDYAIIPLNNHIADKTNPHEVTKAQVGLGSVHNYGVATLAEATEGTINTKYMTPLRTKEAIDFFAGNMVKTHIADKTNPHNVTKAQVDLGSVQNYGVATKTEAEAGTSNVKYMTPLRTAESVASRLFFAAYGSIPAGTVHSAIRSLHNSKANVDSPTLSGTPRAPTPPDTDSSTRIATTAFVKSVAGGTGSQSLEQAAGYKKFAGGFCIQWGRVPLYSGSKAYFKVPFDQVLICVEGQLGRRTDIAMGSYSNEWVSFSADDNAGYAFFTYIAVGIKY